MLQLKYTLLLLGAVISSSTVSSSALNKQPAKVKDNKLESEKSPLCVESTLHKLVRDGDSEGLSKFIAEGGNMYEKDCLQRTALHTAILEGNVGMVSNLLEKELNLTEGSSEGERALLLTKDSNGNTPIMLAIERDNTAVAAALAGAGLDVNDRLDSDNSSLLHFAAVKGSPKAIRWLVKQGLDVNDTDVDRHWIPLHHATFHGKLEAVKALLELDSCVDCVDMWGFTPISRALQRDNVDVAIALSQSGADLNQRLETNNTNLLHFAASKGSPKSIQWLVSKGLNVNETDDFRQWIPLHHAIFHGKTQAAKVLLDLKSCYNCKDKWGFTPLMRAIEQDDVSTAAALVESGADVMQKLDLDNSTLLHLAASNGSVDSIRWLVKQGLNVNDTDGVRLWIPLHFAIFHGKHQAVRILLELKSCTTCMDKWGFTPLMRAVQRDDIAILSALVDSGADLNQRLESNAVNILHFAAASGSIDSIGWLVKQGLNVNDTDGVRLWIPLHHAVFHGKLQAVKVLLELKSCTTCMDTWGFTPLMRAVQRDDIAIVTALVDSGADLNQRLESNAVNILHFAAANGSIDSIGWLVKHGLMINDTDETRQWIPLHHAIFHNKLEAVKLLLQLKSCNSCKDKWGSTPLMLAVQRDDTAILAVLAGSGADLNERLLSDNATLLHVAASKGSPDSIGWLVKHGLDVNAIDEAHQRIPLHYAAMEGKLQAAKVLASLEGSCINCRDKDGSTPLALAKRYNHNHVAEYLISVDGKE